MRLPEQSHTIRVLTLSQVLGSVGFASGLAVGALLAEQVSGSETWAGLGGTFQVLGSAVIAIPVARIMGRSGRRPGLIFGYSLAVLGAVGLVVAGIVGNFPLLLVASVLYGGASTSNSQSRYAALDLADPAHRGRDLSIVVWATTVGAVVGPNLTGPGEAVAKLLHIPTLTGSYLFSLVGFLATMTVLSIWLRPDPLIVARDRLGAAEQPHGSVRRGWSVITARRDALFGMLAVALGHATMVGLMVMTPLHMHAGHADLKLIGFVISVHIVGMYAFSPFTGQAVDRWGSRRVAIAGAGVQALSAILAASTPPGHSLQLTVSMFLLGVGWSGTFVAGSTLLTSAVPQPERPGVQGAADLTVGLAAAAAGALGGVIVDHFGFGTLALGALALPVAVIALAWLLVPRD